MQPIDKNGRARLHVVAWLFVRAYAALAWAFVVDAIERF